ncbi:MAM and fibronectin type III domain-containing protein 1 [Acropora cervicornis]|uniref:MAM and fibronectin type III domain-containing protein 1 n=1 Tax=Acropora cervicornis TaxID=6130 RepID=A0AAD9PRE9_ACRCE|nr:MAM and fibronectin type III domain-containing protein 1 [Acropora cervicornis]
MMKLCLIACVYTQLIDAYEHRLDPYIVFNVSVEAIDGVRSPFKSTVLQARTDKGGATRPVPPVFSLLSSAIDESQ